MLKTRSFLIASPNLFACPWVERLLEAFPEAHRVESSLNVCKVQIDPTQRGNSIQDFRLSLVGWGMGRLVQSGQFTNRAGIGKWVRRDLMAPKSQP